MVWYGMISFPVFIMCRDSNANTLFEGRVLMVEDGTDRVDR